MKHIITRLIYRHALSTGTWYNSEMIPGTGTLSSEISDTENGQLCTWSLSATIPRRMRPQDASLHGGLCLIADFDDGLQARIGTPERPAYLSIQESDTIKISVTWESTVL